MRVFILLSLFGLLLACKTPEARKPVSNKSGSFIKESVQRNKKLVKKEEKRILDLIHKDSVNNYISSSEGFWYYYNTKKSEDSLQQPEFGDLVKFEYDIATLEGKPIYTRKELGEREFKMDQEDVFTGLRQGIKLMKVGETVTFLFPSHTAFGYYGDSEKIGNNVPIKSTITLKSVEKENNNQQ